MNVVWGRRPMGMKSWNMKLQVKKRVRIRSRKKSEARREDSLGNWVYRPPMTQTQSERNDTSSISIKQTVNEDIFAELALTSNTVFDFFFRSRREEVDASSVLFIPLSWWSLCSSLLLPSQVRTSTRNSMRGTGEREVRGREEDVIEFSKPYNFPHLQKLKVWEEESGGR